ncbi:hypothetical protein CCP1ISM_70001 [Azospirillaceae bacterium]
MPGVHLAALAGDLADAEAMVALKDLMSALGSANIDCRQDGARYDTTARAGYLFNTTIAGIEQADVILLVGVNPRVEAPIINARIRKRFLNGGVRVARIGAVADLTYPVTEFGNTPEVLTEIAAGRHPFSAVLKAASRPMIIVGMAALGRNDAAAIQDTARTLADSHGLVTDGWNGFNVLHIAAARVAGLELGFLPGVGGRDTRAILDGSKAGDVQVLYLLGADEIDASRIGSSTFVIYQGHHGDRGAHRADVVLPGAAYTEKNATYLNTEGRVQTTRLATFPPGEAREDWKIIRALSEHLGHRLPYDSLAQIRQRLVEVNPVFTAVDTVTAAAWRPFGQAGTLDPAPFVPAVENFYMTDPISRASVTMAKCTEAFVQIGEGKTGTHG